jgi:hypothetical protein
METITQDEEKKKNKTGFAEQGNDRNKNKMICICIDNNFLQ